jgi:hypothetical protein
MYAPGLPKSLPLEPDLQVVRHTLQTRFFDLAIENELLRSPSSWCRDMQIVIKDTWILSNAIPRTDVASSNASIILPLPRHLFRRIDFRFLWPRKPIVAGEETPETPFRLTELNW